MDLQLAIVLSCAEATAVVQELESNTQLIVEFADPILEYGITIEPNHLVAVDQSCTPPQIVFRFIPAGDQAVTVNDVLYDIAGQGRPANLQILQQAAFPMIEAMYANVVQVDATQIKNVVRQSYDAIADEFLGWTQRNRTEERERYTAILLRNLPPNARVLELGCGAGLPTTQRLAERFQVTGVDISSRQIELARHHVPVAEFLCADMAQLDFPAAHFDAVTAFYSLVHVPREEQPQLLRQIQGWLRPGGLLVASFGAHAQKAGYEADWLGAPMYWSSFDSMTNERMVAEAGFQISSVNEETVLEEDQGETTFLWIVARKEGI